MSENTIDFGTVTVVMPAYNGERYIENAVRSVMAQTYENWHLIVVDDHSNDATSSIVSRLSGEDARVTLVRNEGVKGAAGARNFGLDMHHGAYAAFLDSDDIWEPNKLECQLAKMQACGADMSYTSYAIVDETGNPKKSTYVVPEEITFDSMLKENVVGCSTVILTDKLVKKYRFTTDFYHEDYCLWLDILHDGHKVIGCPDALTKWRLIENSRSFDKRNSAKNRWKIYRQHLRLPFLKSAVAFAAYAVSGVKKYLR